jgi:hypothetical protein
MPFKDLLIDNKGVKRKGTEVPGGWCYFSFPFFVLSIPPSATSLAPEDTAEYTACPIIATLASASAAYKCLVGIAAKHSKALITLGLASRLSTVGATLGCLSIEEKSPLLYAAKLISSRPTKPKAQYGATLPFLFCSLSSLELVFFPGRTGGCVPAGVVVVGVEVVGTELSAGLGFRAACGGVGGMGTGSTSAAIVNIVFEIMDEKVSSLIRVSLFELPCIIFFSTESNMTLTRFGILSNDMSSDPLAPSSLNPSSRYNLGDFVSIFCCFAILPPVAITAPFTFTLICSFCSSDKPLIKSFCCFAIFYPYLNFYAVILLHGTKIHKNKVAYINKLDEDSTFVLRSRPGIKLCGSLKRGLERLKGFVFSAHNTVKGILRQGALLCSGLLCFTVAGNSLASAGFYDGSKEGWYWFEQQQLEVKVHEPGDELKDILSSSQDASQKLAAIRTLAAKQLDQAIMLPTAANIKNYRITQDYVSAQASTFSKNWQLVNHFNPEFDASLKHPYNHSAIRVKREQDEKLKRKRIEDLAQHYGLVFFFKAGCPYCHKYASSR